MDPRYLIVVSEQDPVAPTVAEAWGTPVSTGLTVEGTPIRDLGGGVYLLRRPGLHIRDERFDRLLPGPFSAVTVPLVVPSVHRSDSQTACWTVHPIGNPGPEAEVGGVPSELVPTAPRLMTAALRALHEERASAGLGVTFEATHHGPSVEHPAFFVEIGWGDTGGPPAAAVAALGRVLPRLAPDDSDRLAVGIGGGHYAPHFTELALERRWSLGHILSRHALERTTPGVLRQALERTPGAEGFLFARASDAELPPLQGLAARLRDSGAARRRTD